MSQMQSLNGKRPAASTMRFREERVVPNQHDDLIKYIYDSWHKVSREVENYNQNGSENGKAQPYVAYYYENEPNPMLKDFQPFDLDDWWRKRNSAPRNQPSS